MVYNFIAYDEDKNLGAAYNRCMEMLPDEEDWAVFIDHDAMFTTSDWYIHILEVIKSYPDAGLITCLTNRIYNPIQIVFNYFEFFDDESKKVSIDNHDIEVHRSIGHELNAVNRGKVQELSSRMLTGGVLMVVKKKVWQSIKFEDGFLGVDYAFHRDCIQNNLPVLMMTGLYVYHWYRADVPDTHVSLRS